MTTEAARWFPPGEPVNIGGKALPDGMLYIGRSLPAPRGGTDPALVDPTLKIDHRRPDHAGETMGYWPSYTEISPRARGAYLHWLASGRRDPHAYIGYPFLFLYGIERRLFVDTEHCGREERAALLAEVQRLNRVYAGNRSFAGYTGRLLAAVVEPGGDWIGRPPPEPVTEWSFEIPMDLRVGLGQHIAANVPLPAEWALAWCIAHPDTRRLRTPATRCPEEFTALFARLYRRDHGEGMVLKRPKRTITTTYRPASAGIGEVVVGVGDLPDVSGLKAPLTRLEALVEEATDALDAYSRYLGRNPAARGTAAALALLPDGVGPTSADAEALWAWAQARLAEAPNAVVSTADLVARWPTASGKLGKADVALIARLLDKRGFGIEPDVRFGGSTPAAGGQVVLFRRGDDAAAAPSAEYLPAQAVITLGAAVALADGTVSAPERRRLRDHVTSAFDLSHDEVLRLDAHASLIMANPPTPAALKRKLAAVPAEDRGAIADLLADIAASDGEVSVHEIRTLERLYTALGADPGEVYSRVHGKATAASEPVAVRVAGEPVARVPIPKAVSRAQAPTGVGLDLAVLARKRAESQRVAAHLAEIFAEEEQAPPPPPAATAVAGLDAAHSAFLALLDTRDEWDRAELEARADELGLLLDGALDTINEAAFDSVDAPFWEGSDPILINHDVAEDMRP
ncbi:tellurite resistance TerB family protein [Actinokineospora fastidiosa]|uniref:tellurite resistance TerB family protein n=1 Tax=Actinokineospora fastidiosa TaxID=1816 RepID=UPI001E338FA9|nr:TerB N-terminal domain-containing protein [Actinokineospora fastidiosa]